MKFLQERAGRWHYRPQRLAAVLLVALLGPTPALAWTWQLVPVVDSYLSYETNPDNYAEQSLEDDAYFASLGGSLRMAAATPSSSVVFEPGVRFRESRGNDGNNQLDGNDLRLPLDIGTRNERSALSLSAYYSILPSREADYQVVNPNEPLPPGGVGCSVDASGRCQVDEQQENWSIGPNFDYSLTPLTILNLAAQVSGTTYSEAEITGRFDYDYNFASAGLTHTLDPKHRISASVNVSQYEADQPGGPARNDTDSTGFSLGYTYLLSDQTSINASAGASFSDFRASGLQTIEGLPCLDPATGEFVLCTTESEESSFVGDLFLIQELGDAITTQVGISRELQPNSDGAQTTTDRATAFIQRDVSTRLRLSAGISYIKQEAIGADTLEALRQRFDRDYARLELSLRWQLARHWFVNGQYAYYTEDYSVNTQGINTRNHIVTIGLTYVGRTYR
jgi:hypothetical protein